MTAFLRHPEERAKRASKGDGPGITGRSSFEGRLRIADASRRRSLKCQKRRPKAAYAPQDDGCCLRSAWSAIAFVTAILAGCLFAAPAGAQANVMIQAGFMLKAADTPRKMEILRSLPPDTFVRRTRQGRLYWLYAQPDLCQCAYVGNQQAMDNYRQLMAGLTGGNNPPAGGFNAMSSIEQSMEGDDMEARENYNAFDPGF
jgi:hypothetical protein